MRAELQRGKWRPDPGQVHGSRFMVWGLQGLEFGGGGFRFVRASICCPDIPSLWRPASNLGLQGRK